MRPPAGGDTFCSAMVHQELISPFMKQVRVVLLDIFRM